MIAISKQTTFRRKKGLHGEEMETAFLAANSTLIRNRIQLNRIESLQLRARAAVSSSRRTLYALHRPSPPPPFFLRSQPCLLLIP